MGAKAGRRQCCKPQADLWTPPALLQRIRSCRSTRRQRFVSLLLVAAACIFLLWVLDGGLTVGADTGPRGAERQKQRIELLISRLEQAALYGRPAAFAEELSDGFRDSHGQVQRQRAGVVIQSFLGDVRTLGRYPRMALGSPDVVVTGNEATVRVETAVFGCTRSGEVVFDVRPITLLLAKEEKGWKVIEAHDLMGIMVGTVVTGEPGLGPRYRSNWHRMRLSGTD